MFVDSKVTRISAYSVVEESQAMPHPYLPAAVGSGVLAFGLDASGLQGLPAGGVDEFYKCRHAPFHATQTDLYVLHTGLNSEHLFVNEVKVHGKDASAEPFCYGMRRNHMPLGFLTQEFAYGDVRIDSPSIPSHACLWERKFDLGGGVITTKYLLDDHIGVEIEVFSPHNGEDVYVRLRRRASRRSPFDKTPLGSTPFTWTVRLALTTRGGIEIFTHGKKDGGTDVQAGTRTLLARIEKDSLYKPTETYAVLYGLAAAGMDVSVSQAGLTATMTGPMDADQEGLLRLTFRRFSDIPQPTAITQSPPLAKAAADRDALEKDCGAFTAADFAKAREAHGIDYQQFWAGVADIAVASDDPFEQKRQYLLHMSQYLARCTDDYGLGGTAQFALNHQNGWGASSFHDQHYIVDGLAKSGFYDAAVRHAYWAAKVMKSTGRPFPWMMTYDGTPTITPERDRAPMSDSNRAILNCRIYEHAGLEKDALLREAVYPVVRRVAQFALTDWFVRQPDGQLLFRGVENDVMGDEPMTHDAGTYITYLSVLRKAVEYSQKLGVDADLRATWQAVVDEVKPIVTNGRYLAHLGATDDKRYGDPCWLRNINFIGEAGEFLDENIFLATHDFNGPQGICNLVWINFMFTCSDIRLGRADRAEQGFVDSFDRRTHGPGYFEEVMPPMGRAGLPPFATAHGCHLQAACEQIVLSDFWRPRVWVGRGLPSRMRCKTVTFRNLRARDGLMISGTSGPRCLDVELTHTGPAQTMELVLSIPACGGNVLSVTHNGQEVEHVFQGDTVRLTVELKTGQTHRLRVEN